MEHLSKLLSSLALLAWPALVLFIFIRFYEPIKKLIESANGRKFSIKVAGNELTFEEASEQQGAIIQDLQRKIADLETQQTINVNPADESALEILPTSKRLLWVDDNPKNNSYLIAAIESQGHSVDIALSTDEGLKQFSHRQYHAVISDMGRPESDKAGIELAKKIRQSNTDIPFYIFCGKWAATNLKERALSSGVSAITSSGTTLMKYLSSALPNAN